ncbi:MAG: hypothetical protein IT324_12795 [Anaerolineae bacterium]|nr:hypothetical protein [Anaerolineae bacterium]
MHRLFYLAFLVVVVLSGLAVQPSRAQTPTPTQLAPDCKPATVINKAAALRTSGDPRRDLDLLNTLMADIQAMNVSCNGLRFNGRGNKVLGPFALPVALYRVTARTNGDLTVDLQAVARGDCGTGGNKINLLTLLRGQGDQGAEAALDIRFDCKAVFVTSNSRDSWTLTVEPLSLP